MLSRTLQHYTDDWIRKQPLLQWGAKFVNLRNCSQSYQEAFKNAWKAIECDSLRKLKDSIRNMKENATDKFKSLDVCYLQSGMSLSKRKNTVYFMTLLSYAAVHGRKSMVEELLDCGADTQSGNGLSGSPLTQVLTYAQHHNCPEVIDNEITQLLVEAPLDVLVIYFLNETVDGHLSISICSPIELAVKIKRIDIAQQLVMAGANVINPSPEYRGVPQLLDEYYQFGTNEYISWLLDHHLLLHQLPKFIEDVVELNIFSEKCMQMFNSVGRHPAHALLTCGNEDLIRKFLGSRKCPHLEGQSAQLPCTCERLLTVQDVTNRTALQIAAQKGDFESVATLLKFYGDSQEDRQDRALALLAAARRGDIKTVRHFLKDAGIMESIMLEEVSDIETSNKQSVLKYAVQEGLTCLFEVLRHYPCIYEMLTHSSDNDGNTLVHVAALTGNSRLFKVFFPLQSLGMTQVRRIQADGQDIQREISSGHAKEMFEALTLMNRSRKTPLHLAIDHNQICILRTLQERIVERDSLPGTEQNKEKNAWEVFWKECGPKLFIFACSYGSVDAVKFFTEMECPLYYASNSESESPLSAAAVKGKDDTLQYLLSECKYSIPNLPEHSPLLLAAEEGHAACVSILLKHGADVGQKSKYGYNCLMIAIERKFRSTVMTILSDKQGFEALRCRKGSVTPMRMLIEHFPDVAEWVLNKCVLEGHRLRASSGADDVSKSISAPADRNIAVYGVNAENDCDDKDIADVTPGTILLEAIPPKSTEASSKSGSYVDGPSAHHKGSSKAPLLHEFEFFDTFKSSTPKKGQDETDLGEAGRDWQQEYHPSNDIILLMIKHNRKNLLDHFLVEMLISFKWWKVGLPFLLTSYILHLLFLILLTAFALVIPRPGPTCPRVLTSVSNITENVTDIRSCEDAGITEGQASFLTTSAVILIVACLLYLMVKVYIYRLYWRRQFRAIPGCRRTFLKDIYGVTLEHLYRVILNDIYSVVLYLCAIIFVFPVGHECWCFPSWKWQIGALALFMAWVNNFILLKDIPRFGRPITMLFNVYINFFWLIHLPILLILTFAFPFYMLFIATLEDTSVDQYFRTPFHAMWDVLLQAVDGPDSQFFSASLSHKIMTYLLFITFIVAVPVLFSNFLIGEAVGEVDAERKKAQLSIIQSKVKYIQECEQTVPFIRKFSYESKPPVPDPDQRFLELLEQQSQHFLEEFELEGDVQKRKLERLQADMLEATKLFGVLEGEIKQCRKEIAKQTAIIEELRGGIH